METDIIEHDALKEFLQNFLTLEELDTWASEWGYSTHILVNQRRLELLMEADYASTVSSFVNNLIYNS